MKKGKVLKKPESVLNIFIFEGRGQPIQTIQTNLENTNTFDLLMQLITKECKVKFQELQLFANGKRIESGSIGKEVSQILVYLIVRPDREEILNPNAIKMIQFFDRQEVLISQEDSELNRTNKYKSAGLLDEELIECYDTFEKVFNERYLEIISSDF